MALTHKSTWWQFVLSYVLWLVIVSVGQKMCCDPECKQPISWGQTTNKFIAREDELLAYYKWEFITIFSKNVEYNGKKIWEAQVRGKRGYILPAAVKEFFIDCEPNYVEYSQHLHSTKTVSASNNFQDIISPSIKANIAIIDEDKADSISKKKMETNLMDKAEEVDKTSYGDTCLFKSKSGAYVESDAGETICTKDSRVVDAGEKDQGYFNAVRGISDVDNDRKAGKHGFNNDGHAKEAIYGNNNDAIDKGKKNLMNDQNYFTHQNNVVDGITDNSDNRDSLNNIEFCDGYKESECLEKMAEVKKSLLLWFQELGDDEEHKHEDSKIIEEYGTLNGQNYMKNVDTGNVTSKPFKTVEEARSGHKFELSNLDVPVHDINNEKYITTNKENYSELLHINSKVKFGFREKILNISTMNDRTNIHVMDSKANSSETANITLKNLNKTNCLQSLPKNIINNQENESLSVNQGNNMQYHYPIVSSISLYHEECSTNISDNDIAKNEKLHQVTRQKSAATQEQLHNDHNGSSNKHLKPVGNTSHSQKGDNSLVSQFNISAYNGGNNFFSNVTTSYDENVLIKRKPLCQDYCKKHFIKPSISDNQKLQNQNINNNERVQFLAKIFPSWLWAKRVALDRVILLNVIPTVSILILFGTISWLYRKTSHALKTERAGHIQAVAKMNQAMAEQQSLLRQLENFKQCHQIHKENAKKLHMEMESLLQQKLNLEEQLKQASRTLQQSQLNVNKYWNECAQLKCKLSQLEQQHSLLITENQKMLEENKFLALQIKETATEEDKWQSKRNRKVSMKTPKFRTQSKSCVAPSVQLQKDRKGPKPQFTIYHQVNNGCMNHAGLYGGSYYPLQCQVAIDMSQYEHLYQPSNMSRVPKYVDEEIPVETSSQQTPSSQGWQTSTHFV